MLETLQLQARSIPPGCTNKISARYPHFGPYHAEPGEFPTFTYHTQSQRSTMFTSTFIFAKREFNDEFHRLDQSIAEAARVIPGYLGEESWENATTGLVSNVYYWESLESLQELMRHPRHLEAKAKHENWLAGYQVVISQVIRMYGDDALAKVLPVTRMA